MASDSNSSPSEDITSGTDLSKIHSEDEEQNRHNGLDASKVEEITTHGRIP